MAGEFVACIECERIFEQFRDDVWTCGECVARERDRARAGGGGVDSWSDPKKKRDMKAFLRKPPKEQISVGRGMRFSATKKGTPGELPTCSRCGATSVLEPCRACAPPGATMEYWHGTMSRTKAKKKRR